MIRGVFKINKEDYLCFEDKKRYEKKVEIINFLEEEKELLKLDITFLKRSDIKDTMSLGDIKAIKRVIRYLKKRK